jgi:hypothetical protein
MAIDVKPGQWVTVKVINKPKRQAAVKTMHRVLEQDPAMKTERKRLSDARPGTYHTRGGRPWLDKPARLKVVSLDPGAEYKVFATVQALRDLNSVENHVQVTPA